jgi:ssDNA-binding replication factor A large subunit
LRVADAMLKDDSGTIKMSLWNDDATRFKAGDKIKITNGYVNEFQGDKQLTAGKFGKIEKLGEGSSDSDSSDAVSEEASTEVEQPEAEESAEVSEEAGSEEAEGESGSGDIKEETI